MSSAMQVAEIATIVQPMSQEEIEQLAYHEGEIAPAIDRFRESSEIVVPHLVEIHDKKLYRANYLTFPEYCRGEWGIGHQVAGRMMNSFKASQAIAAAGLPAPSRQRPLRPILHLPPDTQVQVYGQAIEDAGGKSPTEKQVAASAEKAGFARPPKPRSKTESPEDEGRRRGIIPEGAAVETITPANFDPIDPKTAPVGAVLPEPPTDEEFLSSLPARSKMQGLALQQFDACALAYRDTQAARDAFRREVRKHMDKAKKGGHIGPWPQLYYNFFSAKGPEGWVSCAMCRGSGQLDLLGRCSACRGHGYQV